MESEVKGNAVVPKALRWPSGCSLKGLSMFDGVTQLEELLAPNNGLIFSWLVWASVKDFNTHGEVHRGDRVHRG